MDKNIELDKKIINQVLRILKKILKKTYIFIFIISIYVSILILNKLNIMLFIINVLKILSPLFIGIVFAWLLRPLVRFITNKKISNIIAVIMIYIILLFLCFLLLSTFIPIFIKETNEFLNMAPSILNNITDFIDKKSSNINIDLSIIENEVFSVINNFITKTGKDIPITLINLIKGIGSVLLGLIIGFYLLITDVTFVKDTLNKYLKHDTYDLLVKINTIFRNYVRGTLFSSLLVFILSTIFFYIIGLEGALLFGFICGVTNIIPFIGPYIGAFIPVVVAFTKNTTTGILVTIIIFIIQTIESNIIHPLIISKSIKVHPVTVIISLLVFGYFFGIIGMIVATPLVAVLKEIYFYLLKRYNSYKRKLVR